MIEKYGGIPNERAPLRANQLRRHESLHDAKIAESKQSRDALKACSEG